MSMLPDAIYSLISLLSCACSLQDIKLFINSPGGSVTAGMGIYDAMKVAAHFFSLLEDDFGTYSLLMLYSSFVPRLLVMYLFSA